MAVIQAEPAPVGIDSAVGSGLGQCSKRSRLEPSFHPDVLMCLTLSNTSNPENLNTTAGFD